MKNLIQFTIRKDNVYGSQASGAPGELRAIQSEINVAFFVLTSPLLGQIVEVVQVVPPELGHIGTDPVDLASGKVFSRFRNSKVYGFLERVVQVSTGPMPIPGRIRTLLTGGT